MFTLIFGCFEIVNRFLEGGNASESSLARELPLFDEVLVGQESESLAE